MDKLNWETQEYHYTEKTADWYWIVGIVTITIAIIAIILNNIVFAILILVASFTLTLFASKPPKIMEVEINNLGVNIGRTHYPYGNLESFWVETREHVPKVLFKSKKLLMPYIVVFIEDVEPGDVRLFLLNHLAEEEHVEPFLEKLLIYLGF
jgi:hypothetical protein